MKPVHLVCGWIVVAIIVACLLANTVTGQEEAEVSADNIFGDSVPAAREASTPAPLCDCLGETSTAVAKIKQVLAAPLKSTGLEFQEQSLEEVVSFLREEYGIPIQLEVPALEDVGLGPDEPVTVNIQNVSLKSALRLMLKQKQLTYVIHNEVLLITTPDEAETQLVTCVYDVRDLVSAGQSGKDIQALIHAIYTCIATETWAGKGGGAPAISSLRRGVLIVSQTRVVHDEIAELLDAVRRVPHDPREPTLADAARAGRGAIVEGRVMGGGDFEGGYGSGRAAYGGRGGYGEAMGEGYGGYGEPVSTGGELDE